jgi:hypothetical protein
MKPNNRVLCLPRPAAVQDSRTSFRVAYIPRSKLGTDGKFFAPFLSLPSFCGLDQVHFFHSPSLFWILQGCEFPCRAESLTVLEVSSPSAKIELKIGAIHFVGTTKSTDAHSRNFSHLHLLNLVRLRVLRINRAFSTFTGSILKRANKAMRIACPCCSILLSALRL